MQPKKGVFCVLDGGFTLVLVNAFQRVERGVEVVNLHIIWLTIDWSKDRHLQIFHEIIGIVGNTLSLNFPEIKELIRPVLHYLLNIRTGK